MFIFIIINRLLSISAATLLGLCIPWEDIDHYLDNVPPEEASECTPLNVWYHLLSRLAGRIAFIVNNFKFLRKTKKERDIDQQQRDALRAQDPDSQEHDNDEYEPIDDDGVYEDDFALDAGNLGAALEDPLYLRLQIQYALNSLVGSASGLKLPFGEYGVADSWEEGSDDFGSLSFSIEFGIPHSSDQIESWKTQHSILRNIKDQNSKAENQSFQNMSDIPGTETRAVLEEQVCAS
ncbi:hypothetical protein TWF481_002897 [Arthrobotrys musiformis]|uniref:Uncharacterized protein n=1 Tax=Arthrobotrys musiformis TaxID=47236 RepID=A0AAV9VRK2_9PEZI